MMPSEYRDVLWDITHVDSSDCASTDVESFTIRSFPDETALFEAGTSGQGANNFRITLPLETLVGTRDSKTRWTQRRVTRNEAVSAGRMLWDALPAELLQIFDEPPSGSLRLKIYSTLPRVTDLPWEWLADRTGQPVALRPDVRLVRCVPLRFHVSHLTVRMPIKVLIVVTNPKDERLLDPYQEISAVSQQLQLPDYQMQVCPEPTLETLRNILHDFLPHIVHYIGHAGINNEEGNLILHDNDNRTYWLPASFLSRLLPSTVRLLCLSTCFSAPNYQLLGLPHLAHAPSVLSLPTTVANCYPVGEMSVRAFWDAFYASLISEQGDVNAAAHIARQNAANAEPYFADWASFSVVLRDRTGKALHITQADDPTLESIQASELQAQYAARLANDLAQQVTVFGDYASKGVREQFDVETRRASDLLKIAGDMTKDIS